jgi:hypothetical protein
MATQAPAAPPQPYIDANPPRRVNIESPCKGRVPAWVPKLLAPYVERASRYVHHAYAIRCVRDSLDRGESPYASHVFFDGAGVLDDADVQQRALGMNRGAEWAKLATLHAFYLDHGWSRGMQEAHERCMRRGWDVELRYLDKANAQRAAERDAAYVKVQA